MHGAQGFRGKLQQQQCGLDPCPADDVLHLFGQIGLWYFRYMRGGRFEALFTEAGSQALQEASDEVVISGERNLL